MHRTPTRLALIGFFLDNPGAGQTAAAAHLGIPLTRAASSTRGLVSLGVLIEEPTPGPGTSKGYTVNSERVAELLEAVRKVVTPD